MYINTGYLNNSRQDFIDKSCPLVVGSCGNYRLSHHPKMPTYRPRGRIDYQIIYVSAGQVHFHFDKPENETIVPAGNIVLFRPRELQKYEFYGKDKTEVFWIHFTGKNVRNILRQYGFPDRERVFRVGTSREYEELFRRIISELQRTRENYEELSMLLLRQLLIRFQRALSEEHGGKNEYLDAQMEEAARCFSENYMLPLSIEDYAAAKGMSISWFIRSFKNYTRKTPLRYLTTLRMSSAQLLLESTGYSIGEISRMLGYSNPLYFSRIFHKEKGCSPSEYRKRMET